MKRRYWLLIGAPDSVWFRDQQTRLQGIRWYGCKPAGGIASANTAKPDELHVVDSVLQGPEDITFHRYILKHDFISSPKSLEGSSTANDFHISGNSTTYQNLSMGSVEIAPKHDQTVHTVRISDAIRQKGHPSLEFIAEAVSFFHKDGIVILENVIDAAHLEHLDSILAPEALEIANDPNHHFNFGKHTRNMDQAPPLTRELMYKDVWANSFACAVLSAVLGPRPVIHYANGNTALQAAPGGRQPVHSDCEFDHPVYFPFACVVNINLVDTSSENGATEIWPGSHHVSTPDCHAVLPNSSEKILHVRPEYVEERRRHSPPIQPCTKRGSIVIRDLRLWHAGMPNLTPIPRIMLAYVAQPAWFQGKSKILLPLSVKDLVESWSDEVQFSVDWIDGEVDHKKISSANVDFGTNSLTISRNQRELSTWPGYAPRWF